MQTLRLRQAVVAAADLDTVVDTLTGELGTGIPHPDPGVATFGLRNAVIPVGDTFLEVVSPLAMGDGSAAERYMERQGGDCGYMAIFQVADMDEARAHLSELGVRTVWNGDFEQIRGTHVHPADIGAAIVSFDQPTPPESWHWAGPTWPQQVRTDVVTGLAGITLSSPDPGALSARWSAVLAAPCVDHTITLPDHTAISFVEGERTALIEIGLRRNGGQPRSFRAAGVEFRIA